MIRHEGGVKTVFFAAATGFSPSWSRSEKKYCAMQYFCREKKKNFIKFEEVFLETREQYLKLRDGGYLLFDQVPLVEMDGLKLVQTKAILNYIAGKYNLLGEDLKERAQYSIALEHHKQEFLVGNRLSFADIQLLEAILMLEERKADILAPFPQLQVFKARISSIPTIKKFLEPGSQRKPIADDAYVAVVLKVLQLNFS
ncbi:hypothetical protein Chor_006923 [Crotalus horridus]